MKETHLLLILDFVLRLKIIQESWRRAKVPKLLVEGNVLQLNLLEFHLFPYLNSMA